MSASERAERLTKLIREFRCPHHPNEPSWCQCEDLLGEIERLCREVIGAAESGARFSALRDGWHRAFKCVLLSVDPLSLSITVEMLQVLEYGRAAEETER